ncbi:hypothetical protein SUGI_1499150 [Cryptomeria japonica]|uniref:Uncharacterized protein n=1 Tax=Cryptomeria japonica TaxID=3369 RepID=A0AAD3NVN7_CRYJA|nr:hypothetical protein SUGI_1492350 [Cryptomeria japonica]GLJ59249.1 hypothetical protein SUGI_1499150 [Cryptomeria japonica]
MKDLDRLSSIYREHSWRAYLLPPTPGTHRGKHGQGLLATDRAAPSSGSRTSNSSNKASILAYSGPRTVGYKHKGLCCSSHRKKI